MMNIKIKDEIHQILRVEAFGKKISLQELVDQILRKSIKHD